MANKQDVVNAVANALKSKNLSNQAVAVLKQATEKVLSRAKQNLNAQLKEDTAPIVEDFVKNVINKLSASTQEAGNIKNESVIFPEGTRYIFRDGQYSTIIVEQPPQTRVLKILGKNSFIALPYVQFTFVLINGEIAYDRIRVTVTKSSVASLDTGIYCLPLPNVNNDHAICVGTSKVAYAKETAENVSTFIGGFWQSDFTADLSMNYFSFLKKNDMTVESWISESKKDSSFILSKSFLPHKNLFTLRSLLAKDNDGGITRLAKNIKQDVITAIGTIGGTIQELIGTVDLDSQNTDKNHMDTLQNILKEIIVQAYSELWDFLKKDLEDERTKLQKDTKAATEKLKRELEDYKAKSRRAGGPEADYFS